MPDVLFINHHKSVSVAPGTTVLAAARAAGVPVESPCNGIGTCGRCKVKLVDGSRHIAINEGSRRLSEQEAKEGWILSCQTKVIGDIVVGTVETAAQNSPMQISVDGESFRYAIEPAVWKRFDGGRTLVYAQDRLLGEEAGNTTGSVYGVVIDIGTTTLVVALMDLLTGEELASDSALNPQSVYAQDVLTRIHFAGETGGLETLYTGITGQLNRMIGSVALEGGIDRRFVYEAVYSGNTAMVHLALNMDPESLGRYPYTPRITGAYSLPAKGILDISPFANIYIPPVISAYVGPDITSGILALQLQRQRGVTLFIDIGTNGEMAVSCDGRITATSTAAGPAFEGMNIFCGMRAASGAIEAFQISADGEIHIRTIGDAPAVGICGSGLLDIVGELVNAGAILPSGSFAEPGSEGLNETLKSRLVSRDGETAFRIAGQVCLTQKDIRQVQLAKGAIRAGVESLLLSQKLTAGQVDRVQIAGSFGHHLRESSLLHLGLLPKEFKNKVDFVGNTSKSGGKAFLLNKTSREQMREVASSIGVVELASQKDFNDLFIEMLNF